MAQALVRGPLLYFAPRSSRTKLSALQRRALNQRTVAEFFAGIGLMRLALQKQGWQVVFANDMAADKRQMYVDEFGEEKHLFSLEDIHELDSAKIPCVGLATASFPCNDLSLAGMREGLAGSQSSAYWGFIGILERLANRRPPIVLLENVSGFLTSHGGNDFAQALLALNQLGYATDAFIIDAERFVPQSRVRLFVVASLTNSLPANSARESGSFYESDARPTSLAEFIFSHPEIDWNIRELPRLPRGRVSLPDVLDNHSTNASVWWNESRTKYLMDQMSEKHARQLREMMASNRWSYGTVFRRIRKGRSMAELRTDGIAGCLRTPRGGSGRQILVKAGYAKVHVRLLTPQECARLMGADGFAINVPQNQALFGFGDAVCVPVVEWIARSYLNPLADELVSP